MKYLFSCIILIFFIGCAKNTPVPTATSIDAPLLIEPKPNHLVSSVVKGIPQNGKFYSKFVESYDSFFDKFQEKMDSKFNRIFFKPWHLDKNRYKKSIAMWPFNVYPKKVTYSESYLKISKEWFSYQKNNADFSNFNKLNRKAISIVNTNLRNFPSEKPVFGNIKKTGEGFPFDYSQNSALKVNSPILVSHLSKDRAWAFVQSSFALGWVPIRDIAFVDDKFIKSFENSNYVVAIKDKFAIYDTAENFRFYSKIGTIFPILKELKDGYVVAIATKDLDSKALLIKAVVKKGFVLPKPVKFNSLHTTTVFDSLINEPYSWGGLLKNRDCSSMTRDFFAPFGIWLPRNSGSQKGYGEYISLKEYKRKTKEDLILENGIPFLTLIYLKGHIMLYIGEVNGKPAVLHNTWGVKTVKNGKESRHIIGKTIVSTLDLAKDVRGVKRTLLDKVKGMTILADSELQASINKIRFKEFNSLVVSNSKKLNSF